MEDVTATLNLKTVVQSDYVQEVINNAIAKALKTVANRAIVSTLPFTLKDAKGKSPSQALKKSAINKLKARIKGDIMGDGKLGSGIRVATVGGDGDAMINMEGGGYMPFVVQRKEKKKKKSKKIRRIEEPRYLVSSAQLLLNHIKNNTIRKGSGKPMVRFIKQGARYVWTTPETVKNVVSLLQARAGNFLSGWTRLADAVGNKKFGSIISDGNHDAAGDAELEITSDGVKLFAMNESVPKYKKNYASMVESHIPRWTKESINNEIKYALAAINKKKIDKKWYGKE